jgi:hypothetical protein
MATPQLSPGVLVREVDLTVGRAENVLSNIGAISGPFVMGPVEEPIDISTEIQLLDVFGKPSNDNNQYEYWMSASSYLSYGGVLKVVRSDDIALTNSNAAVNQESIPVKIKNFDDFSFNFNGSENFYYAAKNPGTWANGIKVCFIDDAADQILRISSTNLSGIGITVGLGVTTLLSNVQIPGNGTTETFNGVLQGIVTGVNEQEQNTIDVKILSRVSSDGIETPITYSEGNSFSAFQLNNTLYFRDSSNNLIGLSNNLEGSILDFVFFAGDALVFESGEIYENITDVTGGTGSGASFTISRDLDGLISDVVLVSPGSGYSLGDVITIAGQSIGGGGQIFAVDFVSTAVGSVGIFTSVTGTSSGSGFGASVNIERDVTGEIISFETENAGFRYEVGEVITILGSDVGGVDGVDDIIVTVTQISDNDELTIELTEVSIPQLFNVLSARDWYGQQKLNLSNSTILWSTIAEKPSTSDYALQRNSKNDGIHIVVVDDNGSVTGIQGSILERHLNLSKALDTISATNSPTKVWYKDYLLNFSKYIYGGVNPSLSADNFHNTTPRPTGFSNNLIPISTELGSWGKNTQGVTFSSIGNKTYNLVGGNDYQSGTATLSSIDSSYLLFSNKEEIDVDFLIYGPSMSNLLESQAKANRLISIANLRKDCIAVISPYREGVINITNAEVQTENIVRFFSPISSSSYAVFDSGYKYTFDRFNNKFRYIPCNADVAGIMARTSITSFPWFSPAGLQRGILNNAIKLAYNPNKLQRDSLYKNRINSIINQPGSGIVLFGDRTALSFSSSFDRINVRRLFLTIEKSLKSSADAQLFEFNDEITRSNFVNIISPFLRDVQAKRGIFDFRVICDETNNTPDVIDNNEFRADIFLKPNRSINYVTITFVATRTGISFEEVAGNV